MISVSEHHPPPTRSRRRLTAVLLCAGISATGLAAQPASAAPVTTDTTMQPQDLKWGDDSTGESRKGAAATGTWSADKDQGSVFTTTKDTGAVDVWGKSDPNSSRKLTGHGVGIALIDTGVSPVEGLLTPGKVVNGPDLSFESQTPGARYLDGYGHGTHMAGIIAGRDSAVSPGNESDAKHFVGMAPDATIINVKVGAADGGADVSQVVAAVDWVVENKATHNIRVLNLSYGTESLQSPAVDPLAHAVQNAWRAGIVVVVAAGNDGEKAGQQPLTMPAVDPYVLAVGSSDHRGSDKPENETVGAWTNEGTTSRRPDLLAPGKSVVGLRVPGSFADQGHPEGRLKGEPTGRFFRGTGTSQSAAVVSGAAALLVQRNPRLTPDQVKGLLKASADRLMRDGSIVQGAGELDVKGAVELLEKGPAQSFAQGWAPSAGTGSLEASRGGSTVQDPLTGAELLGERDIFGAAWDGRSWAASSTAGTSWSGGAFRGAAWTGPGWSGTSWPATAWTRPMWSGTDWARASWRTDQFLRASWRGDDWTRASWRSDVWTRASWRGGDWSRASWRAANWTYQR